MITRRQIQQMGTVIMVAADYFGVSVADLRHQGKREIVPMRRAFWLACKTLYPNSVTNEALGDYCGKSLNYVAVCTTGKTCTPEDRREAAEIARRVNAQIASVA